MLFVFTAADAMMDTGTDTCARKVEGCSGHMRTDGGGMQRNVGTEIREQGRIDGRTEAGTARCTDIRDTYRVCTDV